MMIYMVYINDKWSMDCMEMEQRIGVRKPCSEQRGCEISTGTNHLWSKKRIESFLTTWFPPPQKNWRILLVGERPLYRVERWNSIHLDKRNTAPPQPLPSIQQQPQQPPQCIHTHIHCRSFWHHSSSIWSIDHSIPWVWTFFDVHTHTHANVGFYIVRSIPPTQRWTKKAVLFI